MLIQKPDASYRPITLIDIITRSVLRLLTLLDRGGIKSYFLDNDQFGLHNTTTPVVRALTTLASLSSHDLPALCVSLDFANAHNSAYQSATIRGLMDLLENCPLSAPVVSACLRTLCLAGSQAFPIRGDINLDNGIHPTIRKITSRDRGGGQGHPELGIAFNATLAVIMRNAQHKFATHYAPLLIAWIESSGSAPLPDPHSFELALWRKLLEVKSDRSAAASPSIGTPDSAHIPSAIASTQPSYHWLTVPICTPLFIPCLFYPSLSVLTIVLSEPSETSSECTVRSMY